MGSLSIEDDLPEAWAKTIAKCQRITGWNLSALENPSVEEVTNLINPAKADGTAKSKAKEAFSKALVCIQTFGGIVAQGASVVFGPSQQVFNAVSFVINATQDYQAVFANFSVLMERLSVFLETLRIHLDSTNEIKLEKDLRLSVYRVLDEFMTIISLSNTLTTGWKAKTKLALKVGAFGEDGGVKAAVARLETLVFDVTKIQVVEIYKKLSEAARNIVDLQADVRSILVTTTETASLVQQTSTMTSQTAVKVGQMREDQEKRNASDDIRRNIENIRKRLSLDDKESWRQKHEDLWSRGVQGYGQWLLSRFSPFLNWADSSNMATNVLSLKGPENYGKTFLCNAVVRHLIDKYAKDRDDTRVAIAYYFVERTLLEESDAANAMTINNVTRAVIYQLAKSDPTFAKHAQKVCEKMADADIAITKELWSRVVVDYLKTANATFFIILDGVDGAADKTNDPLAAVIAAALALPQEPLGLRLRIFASARPKGLEALQLSLETAPSSRMAEIDLQRQDPETGKLPQEEDMLSYVQDRVRKMKISLTSELEERIPRELLAAVQGDYFKVNRKLKAIESSRYPQDVELVLSRGDEDSEQVIARIVAQLNDTLSDDEIKEVNEILAWVSVTYSIWPSVNLLEAALQQRLGKKSLVPLKRQIQDKYSDFFVVQEEDPVYVQWTSLEVEKHLYAAAAGKPSMSTNFAQPQTSFHPSEIALVRKMVKTHFKGTFGSDDDLYDRLELHQFFEAKLSDQTAHVRLSEIGSHLLVLEACLTAMCDVSEAAESETIREYAFDHFPRHMSADQLQEADEALRQNIGRKLLRVLRDQTIIQSWWTKDRQWVRQVWLEEDQFCEQVLTWLQHPSMKKALEDMPSEKDWVATSTASDGSRKHILRDVAACIVRKWWEQEGWVSMETFYRLRNYVAKVSSKYDAEKAGESNVLVEHVDEFVRWARAEIQEQRDKAQWHLRVANTLRMCGFFTEAIVQCDEALRDDPHLWQAEITKAFALNSLGKNRACVVHLENMISARKDLLNKDDKFTESYWKEITAILAASYNMAQDYGAAAKVLRQMLDRELTGTYTVGIPSIVADLLFAYNRLGSHENVGAILALLDGSKAAENDVWLSVVLRHEYHDMHGHILSACHHQHMLDTVDQYYARAMEHMATDPKVSTLPYLRLQRHKLQYYCGHSGHQDQALTDIEDLTTLCSNPEYLEDNFWTGAIATRMLSVSLLDKARQKGFGTPMAESYVARLKSLTERSALNVAFARWHPRLNLARIYQLSGKPELARKLLKKTVRSFLRQSSFGDDNGTGDAREGYLNLAHTFSALNDQVNAVAAWCLMEPDRIDVVLSTTNASTEVGAFVNSDVPQPVKEGTQVIKPEPSSGKANDKDEVEAAEQHMEIDKSVNGTVSTLAETGEDIPVAVTESKEGPGDSDEQPLSGYLSSYCDGGCGKTWTYTDNIYVCQDCLDLQLCPACYEKLQTSQMPPHICSRAHSHLHIPHFDRQEWQQRPAGMMRFGDKLIRIKDWLQGIKQEWELEFAEDVIDAATKFHRWRWLAKRRRAKREASKAATETGELSANR